MRAADWLAIHFQKRTHLALRAIHLVALLMGLVGGLFPALRAARLQVAAGLRRT